jgi:hypothetical protein
MKKIHISIDVGSLRKPIVSILIALSILGVNFTVINARDIVEAAEEKIQSAEDREDILWLARAVYSETKIKEEQLLIAWVIRNRLESESYGDTYRSVVLARGQFSGLNPTDSQYYINIVRSYGEDGPGWNSALAVAKAVYYADNTLRPFSKTVQHFYSPRSTSTVPDWAADQSASHIVRDAESESIRFAFYDNIR